MNLVLCCLLCAFASVLSGAELHLNETPPTSTAARQEGARFNRTHYGKGDAYGRHRAVTAQEGAGAERRFEDTTSSYMTGNTMEDINCPPLEALDFLYFNKNNATEVEALQKKWPCELRIYWKSADLQRLVALVRFLFKYATIVLIMTGLLVNIYSLFVLNSPPINRCNMSVYLKALAVSDIGALIFNVTVGVLRTRSTWVSNLYINNGWICALHRVLLSVFFYYSTWLVVTFTIERLLMIRNPFKIHTWHNEKPAKLAVVILAVGTLGLSLLRSFTTPGFENDNMYGYEPCQANHRQISLNMVPFVLINNIVPSILISTTNICLLINLRQSARDQSNLNATDDQSNTYKITRMLIVISIVYVILYLPIGITSCTELFHKKNEPSLGDQALYITWAKKMMLIRWIRGLCFFLYLLNYVTNFFLYCLSGDIFRQTVKVCVPAYIQKICPCVLRNATRSRYVNKRKDPSTSQRTLQTSSSRKQSSLTCIVPETGYHNTVFLDEEITHL